MNDIELMYGLFSNQNTTNPFAMDISPTECCVCIMYHVPCIPVYILQYYFVPTYLYSWSEGNRRVYTQQRAKCRVMSAYIKHFTHFPFGM